MEPYKAVYNYEATINGATSITNNASWSTTEWYWCVCVNTIYSCYKLYSGYSDGILADG